MSCKFQNLQINKIYEVKSLTNAACLTCGSQNVKAGQPVLYLGHMTTPNGIYCDYFSYLENVSCPNCGEYKNFLAIRCDGIFDEYFAVIDLEESNV